MDWQDKAEAGLRIAQEAGALALDYFRRQGDLVIENKGHLDFVSQADREVELAIRAALARAFPDDGIVGEEHPPVRGASGFTWVIDPIDGTANFVTGIPAWCVILAGVCGESTVVGIIHDPVHGESFVATRGGGARLNGNALRLSPARGIDSGTVCVGYSNRVPGTGLPRLVEGILSAGGIWSRFGSGGLGLAYVAAGRMIGYAEAHMNAWDCLAGQLLVAEAGGRIEDQDAGRMIRDGGRVIAAAPGVFDALLGISEQAFA